MDKGKMVERLKRKVGELRQMNEIAWQTIRDCDRRNVVLCEMLAEHERLSGRVVGIRDGKAVDVTEEVPKWARCKEFQRA